MIYQLWLIVGKIHINKSADFLNRLPRSSSNGILALSNKIKPQSDLKTFSYHFLYSSQVIHSMKIL